MSPLWIAEQNSSVACEISTEGKIGMNKMIVDSMEDTVVSDDGAAILEESRRIKN